MTHGHDEVDAAKKSKEIAYQKSDDPADAADSDNLRLIAPTDQTDAAGPITPDTGDDATKALSNGNTANGNSVISRDALILLPEGGRISAASNENGAARPPKSNDGDNESETDVSATANLN